MSSILKALKKLEEEKAVLRRDPLEIDTEILRGSSTSNISPIRIFLVSVFLFLCGGGVTYFLLDANHGKPPASHQNMSPLPAVSSANQRSGIHQETREAAENKISVNNKPLVLSPEETSPAHHKPPTPAANDQPRQAGISEKKPDQPLQETTEQIKLESPVKEPPFLRVDGIAFQEGTDEVAIVNGVSVSKGSVIGGAKVEEVRKDRVLFSYSGGKIEIPMGKSNR